MNITSSMETATFKWSETAVELIAVMHKHYRIMGHNTGKKSTEEADDDDKIVLADVDEFNGNCNHCGRSIWPYYHY